MPTRKSGGAREAERRKRERASKRPKKYEVAARARLEATFNDDPSAAGAARESIALMRAVIREKVRDPGVDLGTMLNSLVPMAAQIAKASDPEKRIELLTNDLRELGEELERIKGRHAARISRAAPATAPGTALPQ